MILVVVACFTIVSAISAFMTYFSFSVSGFVLASQAAAIEATPFLAGMAGITVAGSGRQGLPPGTRVSSVFNHDGYDYVVVQTSLGRQGFYRSTGVNSGMRGQWLPFDEISGGWINKTQYVQPPGPGRTPLHRFGSDELRDISNALTAENLPRGNPLQSDEHVNQILDFFGARLTPSNVLRPVPDPEDRSGPGRRPEGTTDDPSQSKNCKQPPETELTMTIRIAVKTLSQGTQGPDVAQVHRALTALGRSVPPDERESRVYGPRTVEAIRALQADLDRPATGVVDDATVRVINASLAKRNAQERAVRGSVRLATGAPASADVYSVRAWQKDRLQEHLLGESRLDQEGTFEVRFAPSADAQRRNRIDLRVEVVLRTGAAPAPVETMPGGRAIIQDADLLEVVNFVVVQADQQPQSEYDQILSDVTAAVGDTGTLDRIAGDQLHLLAEELDYPVGHLAAFVTARRMAGTTQLPAPVFYAAIRQGLPADLAGLLAVNRDVRSAAITQAVKDRVVADQVDGRPTTDFVKDLPGRAVNLAGVPPRPGASSFRDLARLVLTDAETDAFLQKYVEANGDLEGFWSTMGTHPKAAAFRNVIELGGLTHNHLPLVHAILGLQLQNTSELAGLPIDKWNQLLAQSGTPADTPGATDAERAANYRKAVLGRVEAAHFRPFFAARLHEAQAPPAVVQFLRQQVSFDPKKTHVERFLRLHPGTGLNDAQKEEVKTYQRLLKVAGNAADTVALRAHLQSAQQIVAMGPKALSEKVPALGAVRAREIYDRARQTNAAALALWSENAPALSRTDMAALPRINQDTILKVAVGDEQHPGLIPDWETLFGSFDLCACDHCNSVQGPAAYFVDVLQFLKAREVLDRLLTRRPDLAEIELSCENSATVLPYIDLVNEVLEDQVARPAPFAELTLAGVSAADFAGPLATEALRNAFVPALQTGTSVEVLENDASWRVVDQQFAYHVTLQGGVFKAVTRSRQTTGSTEERRAYPQYRNAQAYETLNGVFRPWTLPFDRDQAEASVFLKHLGVSRRALIAALRATAEPLDIASPVSVRLATERLQLTDRERRILIGELAADRADFWSGAPIANVQDLLDGSGLSFEQLVSVLATWFVNPDASLHLEPSNSCNTKELTVAGLTDASLSRLHRFVRLWRKLEWTMAEVDKAVHALAANASTPALTNELLVRLAHIVELHEGLKLPVLEVLSLFGPIDTAEPYALYSRLFQHEKFSKSVREIFRLRADGHELNDLTHSLTDQAATLQTVLRVNAITFSQLVAQTDGALNLANLGFLFRRGRLIQAFGLTFEDLLIATALTGIDPFESSQSTLRFVAIAKSVRSSGFGWLELDYVLRHRFQPPVPFVPSDQTLAATLTDVRARLLQLDPQAPDTQVQNLLLDRITAALGVPGALTGRLLVGEPAMDTLLAVRSVPPDQTPSRANAESQFKLLERLFAIALVVNHLKLPGTQWDRLVGAGAWVNLLEIPTTATDVSPIAFTTWYQLVQFEQLRRDLVVEDGALEAILAQANAVAAAADDSARVSAKTGFISTLSQWLGWDASDVESLIGKGDDLADRGLLGAQVPDDYRSPELLLRLSRAVSIVKRLGVRVAQANAWCEAAISADDARAIRSAAMARHDEQAWLQVARPLQDALRNAQRTALVSYLVARPDQWQPAGPTGRVEFERSPGSSVDRPGNGRVSDHVAARAGHGVDPAVRATMSHRPRRRFRRRRAVAAVEVDEELPRVGSQQEDLAIPGELD